MNKKTLIFIAISIFFMVYALLSITIFSHHSFQQYLLAISPDSITSVARLFVLLVALSCIGMPRQVTAFTCGYFFGVFLGVLYATLAVTVAAYITYKIASLFKQSYITIKYNKQLTKLNHFLSVNTFIKTLIIRLLPAGSNFLTNILAGIANIPLKPYLLGSCIGFIPQMVIFSLVGSGVKLANSTHILFAIILLFIATVLGYRLYKTRKADLV